MSGNRLQTENCPSCSAPLPAFSAGAARCNHCGQTVRRDGPRPGLAAAGIGLDDLRQRRRQLEDEIRRVQALLRLPPFALSLRLPPAAIAVLAIAAAIAVAGLVWHSSAAVMLGLFAAVLDLIVVFYRRWQAAEQRKQAAPDRPASGLQHDLLRLQQEHAAVTQRIAAIEGPSS